MDKKQLIDYLEEKKEYLDIMQKDFGNDSWWYSNRKSQDCIKCKVYSYVDTKKVVELLPEKEKATMIILDIDIEKLCNEIVWGSEYGYDFDYCMIGEARRDVLEMLQEKYPEVVDITYHGKQGGWACIQYNFDIKTGGYFYYGLDDLDNDEITMKHIQELKKQVDKAIETIENVNGDYMKAYNELCRNIEDPQAYVYNVVEYIKDRERELLEQLDRKIELSKKIQALQ